MVKELLSKTIVFKTKQLIIYIHPKMNRIMNRQVTILGPNDKTTEMHGAGDIYRFLATGDQTDGEYFLFEGIVPPGGGPLAHIQNREEEGFYILEGEVTFYTEGKEVVATAGTFLNIPKGVKHRFRNNSDKTAKMLLLFAPSGLENMFNEMGDREEEFANHPKGVLYALNEIGEAYGVEFFEKD